MARLRAGERKERQKFIFRLLKRSRWGIQKAKLRKKWEYIVEQQIIISEHKRKRIGLKRTVGCGFVSRIGRKGSFSIKLIPRCCNTCNIPPRE